MRHRKKKVTLDRKKAARLALLKTLATQFVLYEKITSTDAKVRALRPFVERLITRGKKNTLFSRRHLLKFLTVPSAVSKILEEIAPRYIDRPGGYTRITKLNQRKGDGAQIAKIEFV